MLCKEKPNFVHNEVKLIYDRLSDNTHCRDATVGMSETI